MHHFIGILDIFGFEIFEINSFEQLCINYTDNFKTCSTIMFLLEEEQYKSEHVDFNSVAIVTTLAVRLLNPGHGILVQLDQICRVGRSSKDAAYLEKLDSTWGQKTPKDPKTAGCMEYYRKPKVRRGIVEQTRHSQLCIAEGALQCRWLLKRTRMLFMEPRIHV